MNIKTLITCCIILGYVSNVACQEKAFELTINLSVAEAMQKSMVADGRLFVFLNQSPDREPRTQTWPSKGNYIFAKNMIGFPADKGLKIKGSEGWSKTPEWAFENIPEGEYYMQVLWDQDMAESRISAPGNLYSEKKKITVNKASTVDIALEKIIGPYEVVKHDLVKTVNFKSDTLSKWWGKPIYLKASILLPAKYEDNPDQAYPIRYNVAGYGGRYTRINRVVNDKDFMSWWQSDQAPQVINVFLDGEGPFGDCYQMDSDNSGPYGFSLIHELIPHIEKNYRGTNTSETRFVDGCSTGGWVSLGLQLYYPNFFNGVFSYSPDAIEFEDYQLINIYKDKNAYINEYGYLRPVMRSVFGEPMMSVKEFIQYENVLGTSNTYLNSGGQFSAHTALYSTKGANNLPQPLFDPVSGEIDNSVAESWKKYDFKIYAEKHWETLGPKIQGKIFIWMGDMDHFYLNPATRVFDEFLKTTKNPTSDAEIVFSPMEGHCSQFSHRVVLEQIQSRLKKLKK
ncbi:MAG: hypothetical protein DHS20C18_01900 [Saprospiraceae bacterium]|nr:MAG: hypothetical protein DHS20C18_01900 [Saprospiraceae bacterium]